MQKKIVYITTTFSAAALFLLTSLPAGAQQNSRGTAHAPSHTCPVIAVNCPDAIGRARTFKVSVTGLPPDRPLTYEWEVHNGLITRGQGTAEIVVEVEEIYRGVTATVTVGGLDPGCALSASCTMTTHPPPSARRVDSFGRLPFSQVRRRLDAFATEVRGEPGADAFIVAHGRGVRGERARRYLIERHGFKPRDVFIVKGDASGREVLELYLVPTGAMPPAASNGGPR